jgi:hypothetical protein
LLRLFSQRFSGRYSGLHNGAYKITTKETTKEKATPKMPDKVLLTAIGADALFLATGAIQLGFCLVAQGLRDDTPRSGQEAIRNLLYQRLPLTAGIANAALVLITFAFTLPGLASQGRAWLKVGGYMVTVCGVFTLCVGVYLWVMTLCIKANFAPVYLELDDTVQSLVQTSVGSSFFFFAPLQG